MEDPKYYEVLFRPAVSVIVREMGDNLEVVGAQADFQAAYKEAFLLRADGSRDGQVAGSSSGEHPTAKEGVKYIDRIQFGKGGEADPDFLTQVAERARNWRSIKQFLAQRAA